MHRSIATFLVMAALASQSSCGSGETLTAKKSAEPAPVAGPLTEVTLSTEPLAELARVSLKGDLAYEDELSGVAFWGDFVIACPDEGAEFNVLRQSGSGFKLVRTVNLLPEDDEEEIDMEGCASDGRYVYIVGSHSLRRKQVDDKKKYEKNRKRLTDVAPHPESYRLFRLTLDEEGKLASKEEISLAEILRGNEILQPYVEIPGKENGIDIEGIAVRNGRLSVGFRGPVLRGNFVPVMSFAFDQPEAYELKFVPLDGRGIRDLLAVNEGFLMLAGPVGDGDASCRLLFWNGEDCVPGENATRGRVTTLGTVLAHDEEKPEGIALVSETADQWRLMLVCDGEDSASELMAPKPAL
jgi:hypothetical protein